LLPCTRVYHHGEQRQGDWTAGEIWVSDDGEPEYQPTVAYPPRFALQKALLEQ